MVSRRLGSPQQLDAFHAVDWTTPRRHQQGLCRSLTSISQYSMCTLTFTLYCITASIPEQCWEPFELSPFIDVHHFEGTVKLPKDSYS